MNFAAVVSTNSPITEGMEGTLPSANCSVLNPDNGITFAKSAPGGFGTSSNSAKMDCYNYAATGENDYLVIPPVDFSVATNPQINFNVAYAPYDATYFEKLDVEISTDCGTTWTNVYSKSGATLGTAPAITTAFAPTASQWRSESISLTSYIGQPNVMTHFKCTNGFGNNLYIDNINITAATGIASINSPGGFSIYPNPATSSFTIEGASKSEKVHYSVYNMVGAEIKSGEINVTGNSFQGKVQATNMSSGVYFLRVNDDNYSWVQKVTIK